MQFSTQVPIGNHPNPIDYNSKIVSLGSCFAENMGEKFAYFKFQSNVNPFGIIFNPISIENSIRRAIDKTIFTEKDIFLHNDLWHSFEVHSELSHSDKEALLINLNNTLESTRQQIVDSTHIIITLGTAWVYKNIESDSIVTNCHKVPQKQFTKELLSVETIQKSLNHIIDLVASVNKETNILFTISPVRHIKDGFVENQRSKSHLITALHNVLKADVTLSLSKGYFPSYEIMMDELRDYRFYNQDMLHPNQVAIDYIWKRFSETTIAKEAFSTMEEVDSVQKSLQHRPFNPNSESHQKFLDHLNQKINKLALQFPNIKF
ncbi:GSCFA domain-containing protein [Flavobacterium sp.]|uniref:GSCFA domain-containing protein n=1 Tax=Flavobacterium sp. TaxID=239 RepID=UPI0026323261|nr:GSCFA domain-containing protein [Flavobacterium sp.]